MLTSSWHALRTIQSTTTRSKQTCCRCHSKSSAVVGRAALLLDCLQCGQAPAEGNAHAKQTVHEDSDEDPILPRGHATAAHVFFLFPPRSRFFVPSPYSYLLSSTRQRKHLTKIHTFDRAHAHTCIDVCVHRCSASAAVSSSRRASPILFSYLSFVPWNIRL